MKNFTLFFIGFFCITAVLIAQNTDVKSYFEDQHIGGLANDGENIWVGVDSLLVRINKTTGETIASCEIPISTNYLDSNRYALSISLDKNGKAWIICIGPLVYLETFDGVNTWTEIPLPSAFLFGLIIDEEDKVWISSFLGMHEYVGTEWQELTPNWPYFATAIAVDNENNKWLGLTDSYLGAQTGYLTKFEGTQSNILSSPYLDAPGGLIRSIGINPAGIIWMGTWGKGLIKFDGLNWQVYNASNSEIPLNRIENVTVEGANIIWMSTENGLTRFDGVTWKTFNTENSILPSNTINSILVDENGTKWVGTDKGLISFKGNSLSTSDEQNSKVQFKLFPNPANHFVTLNMPLDAINPTIEVFNVQGKLMKSMKMTNISYKMDISTFPSGMYFIQLKTTNGMAIKKFVKQN
ncbi:T9SS type A sorting domain-containing protein [Flavobacteriaceae bacterium SZ-1-7]|uniref:T9SS type A sorting domain-containing protein n=1 Tax=Tamlana sedimenti TaxID=3134126 RepID=UPI003127373A